MVVPKMAAAHTVATSYLNREIERTAPSPLTPINHSATSAARTANPADTRSDSSSDGTAAGSASLLSLVPFFARSAENTSLIAGDADRQTG